MKDHSINLLGQFDELGKLHVVDKSKMLSMGKNWKNTKVVVTIEALPDKASGLQLGYYYKKIVPDFKSLLWKGGQRMTDKQVDDWLRRISPVCIKYVEGIGEEIREVKDLSTSEISDHIDHLRQIAAEEFDFNIEDPKR